ncbi:hypothetical protein DOY81_003014 [Sarcophaga bullata]|nr:hypothetical protein DOY81_003014 [Sarcophaga bullata]
MFPLKPTLSVVLIIICYGLTSVINAAYTNDTQIIRKANTTEQFLNETLTESKQNVTEKPKLNARAARTLLSHSRTPNFTLRRRQPIKIRARADHFPLRPQLRRVHNSLNNAAAPPQSQNIRFGFESLKSSKYIPSNKGANPSFLNKRPQLLSSHPNSIHVPALSQQYIHNFKASPSFNGQVVIHPVTQTQKKAPITNQDNNYPKYVKPQQQSTNVAAGSVKQQQQQQKPTIAKYPDFKQYPIPDQEKMQKYNEQHEKYLQQQKYLTPQNPYYQMQQAQIQQQQKQQTQSQTQSQPQPYPPSLLHQELPAQTQQQQHTTYGGQQHSYLPQSHQQQQQHQQQLQQASIPIPIHDAAPGNQLQTIAFPSAATVPHKMYSVYEENDMTELQNNNYQTAAYHSLDKDAQEYLRFMNTNEYFLPKKDPNYKQIDEETDRRQQYKGYEPLHQNNQNQIGPVYQQLQQQQPIQAALYSNNLYGSEATGLAANSISTNAGIPISQLYYQQEPSASSSSTVVRTSYQAGYNQNQFVVNTQDKQVATYTVPQTAASTPSSVYATTPSPVYSYARHSSAGNRTPEPLRFEFTERDAMVGGVAYTHAPQEQLRYNSLVYNSVTPIMADVESSTISTLHSGYYSSTHKYANSKGGIKPVVENDEDDPEDGDDMEEAGNNLYGRQPVANSDSNSNKQSSTTVTPPSEQKDTEEYCERICAIVEDENEEIVCGSDGYMYTSEAQMECYASCLHIDVTIQGKGSCSTR